MKNISGFQDIIRSHWRLHLQNAGSHSGIITLGRIIWVNYPVFCFICLFFRKTMETVIAFHMDIRKSKLVRPGLFDRGFRLRKCQRFQFKAIHFNRLFCSVKDFHTLFNDRQMIIKSIMQLYRHILYFLRTFQNKSQYFTGRRGFIQCPSAARPMDTFLDITDLKIDYMKGICQPLHLLQPFTLDVSPFRLTR